MVDLIRTDNSLRIVPDDLEALADAKSLWDVLESHFCNSDWEEVRPEECGALTEGFILSEEAIRNEERELIKLGRVYWDSDYAVTDALDELQHGRTVEFVARD